jgi:hypothetical protein
MKPTNAVGLSQSRWYSTPSRDLHIRSVNGEGFQWRRPAAAFQASTTEFTIDPNEAVAIAETNFEEQCRGLAEDAVRYKTTYEAATFPLIGRIEKRLADLDVDMTKVSGDQSLSNPLRANDSIANLQSQLSQIQQSLAENRVAFREYEKQFQDLQRRSQGLVVPMPDSIQTKLRAEKLADALLRDVTEKASAENEKFLMAGISAYKKLNSLTPTSVSSSSAPDRGLVPGLRDRIARLDHVKLVGECRFGEEAMPVELQWQPQETNSSSLRATWQIESNANAVVVVGGLDTNATLDVFGSNTNDAPLQMVANLASGSETMQLPMAQLLKSSLLVSHPAYDLIEQHMQPGLYVTATRRNRESPWQPTPQSQAAITEILERIQSEYENRALASLRSELMRKRDAQWQVLEAQASGLRENQASIQKRYETRIVEVRHQLDASQTASTLLRSGSPVLR